MYRGYLIRNLSVKRKLKGVVSHVDAENFARQSLKCLFSIKALLVRIAAAYF